MERVQRFQNSVNRKSDLKFQKYSVNGNVGLNKEIVSLINKLGKLEQEIGVGNIIENS